jgi:hypothetical protein
MSESDNLLPRIWERKISAFAVLLLILFVGATAAESWNIINIVQSGETPPYQIDTAAQLIGAIGSILLTIGLVVLYDKQASVAKQQASIQENQEKLMQADYEPRLKASIGFKDVQALQFEIHNSGKAAAHDVHITWEYGTQRFSWSKSVIPSGEMTGFALKNQDDDWLLQPDETKEFFNKMDEPNISYEINCQDILDNSHRFSGVIDVVEVIESRTGPSEFTSSNNVVDELSNIDSSLQRIHRDIKPSPLEQMRHTSSIPTENSEKDDLEAGDNDN